MAQHNFKIASSLMYVSKAGSASNAGSDPNAPQLLLNSGASNTRVALGQWTVVGSGYYQVGSVNLFSQRSDGYVYVKGTGTLTFTGAANSTLNVVGARDFTFDGFALAFQNGFSNGSNYTNIRLINCIGSGNWGTSVQRGFNIQSWVMINSTWRGTAIDTAIGIILLNSNFEARDFVNAYVDPGSVVYWVTANSAGGGNRFQNNNIQGIVDWNGTQYELKKRKDGTVAVGTNPLIPDLVTVVADIYTTRKCFNEDPKFIDVGNQNFGLQSDSPHIRSGASGTNIGATNVSISVKNTDNGVAGTIVDSSTEIDTSVPTSYILDVAEIEGYVDYIFRVGGKKLLVLNINAKYVFDALATGGSTFNNNVPDAQPLTSAYPGQTLATVTSGTANTVVVAENIINNNDWVRINGQHRTVLSKVNASPNDTLTLSSPLLSVTTIGTIIKHGTELQMQALNPNRLTVLMRTRSSAIAPTFPLANGDWDNEVDPGYGVVGQLFNQEVGVKPGLVIDSGIVYGSGDSNAPVGLPITELAPQWVHIRIYLRHNYTV